MSDYNFICNDCTDCFGKEKCIDCINCHQLKEMSDTGEWIYKNVCTSFTNGSRKYNDFALVVEDDSMCEMFFPRTCKKLNS